MKKIIVISSLLVLTQLSLIAQTKIKTILYDYNNNLPLVGGIITQCNLNDIAAKILIVSINNNDLTIKDNMPLTDPYCYAETENNKLGLSVNIPTPYRLIDCTNINKEQFFCYLMALQPNITYYVRSAVVKKNSSVEYGNIVKVKIPNNFKRMNEKLDVANVWNSKFKYTVLDLVTDEIIDVKNNGFVFTSNEEPSPKTIEIKNGMVHTTDRFNKHEYFDQPFEQYWNTCYKFANEWNFKIWQSHSKFHLKNENLIVDEPIITQNKQLVEMKCGENEEIYYEVNQQEPTRPEKFNKIYKKPFIANVGDIIKAYALNKKTEFISYTNVFIVQ